VGWGRARYDWHAVEVYEVQAAVLDEGRGGAGRGMAGVVRAEP
jgi:hypothetical protein